MSMDESTSEGSAGFGGKTDRRETNRFPVTEDVKYVVTHSKASKTRGSGKTLNFGSGGLLFTTEDARYSLLRRAGLCGRTTTVRR